MWQGNDYKNPNPFKTASDVREREERERITKQKILLGEAILKKAEEAWTKIEAMNEKIKLTEDDMLKSSLRREKNLFAEQMEKYVSDGYDNVCNVVNSKDFMSYKVKFMQSVENDMDLMKKHYSHFNYRNPVTYEPENEQLLEVRSLYKNLKEKITQELVSKNVDEEYIAKTWEYISKNCEKHEQKCKAHEAQIIKLQETVMMCGVWRYGTNPPKNFTDAKPLEDKLNQYHIIGLSNLKFNSDQLVKQSIAKGFEISGQLPEESSIILEIKSVGDNLKETINKSLADKNIEEEVKNQVWQMSFYSSKYNQFFDKLKTHEQLVRVYEDKILNCETLSEANSLNMELKKIHNDAKDELSFHMNQVIRHFYIKALQISNQSLEESPMMLDIKNIHGGFKEKINKNYEDNLINEKIKSAVDELFNPKCSQHLEKLKLIEKSVRQYEDQLLMCDNFKQSKNITDTLNKKQKEIDRWKLDSDNLIEEIMNKATEFAYKELEVGNSEIDNSFKINNTTNSIFLNQQPLINAIENDLSINSFVPGVDSRLLEIKNLLSTFKEKLNTSLDENSNIHQKIKFDVCKIYKSRCEQHLENLKLIEKSVAKYEALPNFQKTEKIINHLALKYKQIDKWKIDSDNLIEKITVQALELSYKIQPNLNEQNNLQVQKLSDQVTELTKIIDKMSQNPMGMPPINELDHDKSDIFQILNLSQSIKSVSSFEDVEGFLKNNDKKEKELKKSQWKGEVKGEIKLIKMGIKNHMEDEIKEGLKYTKNHLTEIINYFMSHEEDFITKGNESPLVKTLGSEGWILDFE